MIGNNFLLDTNIISAWLGGDNAVISNINNADNVFIPVIAVGEMYYGAQYSSKVQRNIDNIGKLISRYEVLPVTETTCIKYGIIKAALRKKGKPIPENDIWIAAIASEHNISVVTRDEHFSEIDEISIERW